MLNFQFQYDGNSYTYPIALAKLQVPGICTPVAFRPDTTDLLAFSQIFIGKAYQFTTNLPVRLIIDGGANAGFASLWFANQFPDADLVAIEPEESNFAVLVENTAAYPRIRRIQAAIWNKPGRVALVTHDSDNNWLGHWGLRVTEGADAHQGDQGGIQAVTIDEILQSTGRKYIDLLKLDIEGAEQEVFSGDCASWLSRTNILLVELHDRFRSGCREAVCSALRNYDFNEQQVGENTFFARKTFLTDS